MKLTKFENAGASLLIANPIDMQVAGVSFSQSGGKWDTTMSIATNTFSWLHMLGFIIIFP